MLHEITVTGGKTRKGGKKSEKGRKNGTFVAERRVSEAGRIVGKKQGEKG